MRLTLLFFVFVFSSCSAQKGQINRIILDYKLEALGGDWESENLENTKIEYYVFDEYVKTTYTNTSEGIEYADEDGMYFSSGEWKKILFSNGRTAQKFQISANSGDDIIQYNLNNHEFSHYLEELDREILYYEKGAKSKKIKGFNCYEYQLRYEGFGDQVFLLWMTQDVKCSWPEYATIDAVPIQGTVLIDDKLFELKIKNKGQTEWDFPEKYDFPYGDIILRGNDKPEYFFDSIPSLLIWGHTKHFFDSIPIHSVPIEVFQDGKPYLALTTQNYGHYGMEIPYGHQYSLVFGGVKYVQKIIDIDTRIMNYSPEFIREYYGGFEMEMDITLFEPQSGEDFSCMEIPFGMAQFEPEQEDIVFDFDYTAERWKLLESIFEKREDYNKNKESE